MCSLVVAWYGAVYGMVVLPWCYLVPCYRGALNPFDGPSPSPFPFTLSDFVTKGQIFEKRKIAIVARSFRIKDHLKSFRIKDHSKER